MNTESNRATKEYAILGLLAIEPKSGYDIKKDVETMLRHFWNESYGSIYPILRRLDQEGLAERTEVPSDKGPKRYVYTITADGLAEFRDWLGQPIQLSPPKNEFLLKLFFGRFSTPEEVSSLICNYGNSIRQMLGTLTAVYESVAKENADDPDFPYWEMTIQCGRESMKSLIHWCDSTTSKLQQSKQK